MICNRPIFGALFTTKAGEHYLLDVNTGKFVQLNLEIVNSLQRRVSDHHPNIKYPHLPARRTIPKHGPTQGLFFWRLIK